MLPSPLRITRIPDESAPTLAVHWEGEPLASLTVSLTDGVATLSSRLRGPSLGWWGLYLRRWDERDVFARLVGLLNRGPGDAVEAFALRKELEAFARDIRALIPPADLRLVMRFWPQARLGFAAQLRSADERAWRQLARVCPGAVLAALRLKALCDAGHRSAWLDAQDAIRRGTRLPVMLDLLTRSLHDDGSRGEHLRRRLLLRWLPAWCNPALLTRGLPAAFTPEDLHRVRRNSTAAEDWYTTMLPAQVLHGTAASPLTMRRVSAFCARHAEWLGDPALASSLLAYAEATGHLPAPRAHFGSWLGALADWESVQSAKEHGRPDADPAAPLPSHLREAQGANWSVTPLRTWGAALEEGRRQKHCLRDPWRVAEVADAGKSLYSVTVKGQRLTLELASRDGKLVVADYRGAADRRPTSAERRVVDQWMAGSVTATASMAGSTPISTQTEVIAQP
jgi:hypothetical protein